MGRGRNARRREPPVRPVERVEVNDKHVGLRFAAFAVALAVGLTALSYGIYSMLTTDPGWVEIQPNADDVNCAPDFTFQYLTGRSQLSPSQERSQITKLYSRAVVTAYRLFTTAEEFEGVHNICYINNHPNEDIEVDPVLYQAIALVEDREEQEEWGERWLYFGLLNNVFGDLFFCQTDGEAQMLDPIEDPEMHQFYMELQEFAHDPEQVDLKLLGDNTLRLEVSEEYRQYAEDVGRTQYIDFGWLRNAFIADYFADVLGEAGFTNGVITSYDGFIRSLGGDIGSQMFSVYGWKLDQAIVYCQTEFQQPVNMANLRAFPLSERDENRMYVYEDGTVRSSYETADWPVQGSLTMYSQDMECGELALRAGMAFIYGSGSLEDWLPAMRWEGVETIYSFPRDGVAYTEPGRNFENVYGDEQVRLFEG